MSASIRKRLIIKSTSYTMRQLLVSHVLRFRRVLGSTLSFAPMQYAVARRIKATGGELEEDEKGLSRHLTD